MADMTIDEKVFREVTDEVKKMGDNTKKIFEDINKNYNELKKSVEDSNTNTDSLLKNKIDSLSSDISTKQEVLDKKNQEAVKKVHDRMDQIEVAMKRPGGIGADLDINDAKAEFKNAKDLIVSCMSLNDRASWEKVQKVQVDPKAYADYVKAFQNFLRRNGDERSMFPEERKAMSEGIDPDGGFLVTPFMSNMIIQRMWEIDPMRELCSVETITTNAIEFMVDRDQVGNGGWETEVVANAEVDTPNLGLKRIPVYTLVAKPRATQQLLEDSGINVEQWLANKISDRMGRVEATAFLTGDGIGKPRGALTYASGTAWGQIEQINMGNATALTADGFIDIKYHMVEYFLNRGTWLMARGTVAAAMKLKDGTGEYIWKPGILATDPSSTILGLPVRLSPSVPAVAANALAVVLGDWKTGYMIVDRLGITIQRDPYTAKPFVEFYTRKRVGGDVINYDAIKIGVIHV